jgi:hypothetical protein
MTRGSNLQQDWHSQLVDTHKAMSTKSLDDHTQLTSVGRPIQNPTDTDERPPDATLDPWLASVRSRGVTFRLSGQRLRVSPWNALTADDQATLRRHRAAIKSLVANLAPESATPILAPEPPAPVPCAYCGCSPCIGADHHAYRVVHASDPAEVERRNDEATAVMFARLPYGHGPL